MAFKREPGDDVKTPLPAENEFAREEKTPADVIFTAKDVTIFRRGARVAVKGFMPFVPKLSLAAGPALGVLLLGMFSHWSSKADKQIKESTETTERAYTAATDPLRKLAARVETYEARLTAAEATNAAQGALLVAQERDFVIKGSPTKAIRRRRVDPGLVKVVAANAAKDSKELAARKAKPAPKIALPPLQIPPPPPPKDAQPTPAPEVPKPVTPPAPSAPTVPEWFDHPIVPPSPATP